MRPTRKRLREIRKFADKTIQSWSAMECPKEDMIIELLYEVDALEEKLGKYEDALRFYLKRDECISLNASPAKQLLGEI